jgi:acetyltransferase
MMEQTRVYKDLKGTGECPLVNLRELENVVVNFSVLVAGQRGIKAIEINPLFVSPHTNPDPWRENRSSCS